MVLPSFFAKISIVGQLLAFLAKGQYHACSNAVEKNKMV